MSTKFKSVKEVPAKLQNIVTFEMEDNKLKAVIITGPDDNVFKIKPGSSYSETLVFLVEDKPEPVTLYSTNIRVFKDGFNQQVFIKDKLRDHATLAKEYPNVQVIDEVSVMPDKIKDYFVFDGETHNVPF